MITFLSVLKSGGIYDAEWVRKLRDGIARNLSVKHRFACLSDVDVPCERLPLEHDLAGWWSKIELFKPGIVRGPTIYLDLDVIITGSLNELVNWPFDFAMLTNFHDSSLVNSSMMWFREQAPDGVYERFIADPQRVIDHYAEVRHGSYVGDQAFVFDTLDRQVDRIASPAIRSYKQHCRDGLPDGTSIVCFHGRPRPTEISPKWMEEHWK